MQLSLRESVSMWFFRLWHPSTAYPPRKLLNEAGAQWLTFIIKWPRQMTAIRWVRLSRRRATHHLLHRSLRSSQDDPHSLLFRSCSARTTPPRLRAREAADIRELSLTRPVLAHQQCELLGISVNAQSCELIPKYLLPNQNTEKCSMPRFIAELDPLG